MDKQTLLKSLHNQIIELERMIRYFAQAEKMQKIDIDLFKNKISRLYDEAFQLENLISSQAENQQEVQKEDQGSTPQTAEKAPPEPTPDQDVAPPVPKMPEVVPDTPPDSPSPLGDRARQAREGVNEIYGKGKAKTSSKSTSNLQPISDILVAIGLNDRFLFTRELFQNDSVLFKSTISKLNGMTGFDEATDYLKNAFQWDWEDQTTEHFLQIVKRRYL